MRKAREKKMNYKSFNLGDWIGHISGVIEDETTLDGNEMRDLVEFLTTLNQEPILDKVRAEIKEWYWQADKQALAKDPCVVDAMVDLFIRTIKKYQEGE